jgi:uncharacterized membrane protein
MTDQQLTMVAISLLIVAAITVVVQLKWLRTGRLKTVVVFLSGAGVAGALRIAGVPPWWFAGEKGGFGFAVSLLLWAWVTDHPAEAREFGRPLLLGMGLTVLALNVVAFALGV